MPGRKIDIRTPDGSADAYVAYPSDVGSWPAVLMYPDGLGLRETLQKMADRLAGEGFYVLVPNVYYRSGAFAPFDPVTVFSDDAERARLMKIASAVKDADVMRDTTAFFGHLEAEPRVRSRTFGVIGYCMGGGLALRTACDLPQRVAAAASIHGGQFLTGPDAPALIALNVRAPVYIGVSEIDRSHTAATSTALEAALTSAGVPHTIELYPGVSHGFAVDDLPVYDRDAAERHWEHLVAFLRGAMS